MHAQLTRSFSRVYHARPDTMAEYRSGFTDRVSSTYITFAIQGCHPELVITPRFLKCIFVLSSEFPEYVGWTYNMSHGRVSTLLLPHHPTTLPILFCPISHVSLFRDRMSIARASEGVSFTVSRSSSFACVFLQHEVLVSRPQLSLRPTDRNETVMICLPN